MGRKLVDPADYWGGFLTGVALCLGLFLFFIGYVIITQAPKHYDADGNPRVEVKP